MTLRTGVSAIQGPDANPKQNLDDKDTNRAQGPAPRNQNMTGHTA